jgi:prepilin-type N-terminal cleavage/methylation domain-containing protein
MRGLSMSRRNRQGGFNLIEVMLVVAILALLSSIAVPMYARSQRKAKRMALMVEAGQVHAALKAFYLDNNKYPAAGSGPDMLNLSSLAPLTTNGYLSPTIAASFLSKLNGGQVTWYFTFWIDGEDHEIWMFLRPNYDPNQWIYIFDTRVIWGSQWHDGVYVWEDGEYRNIDEIENL